MASIDRTAYPRFKRVVSVRELAEAFTPVADEVEWARGRSQGEPNFLALVVLLKCYQRLGYFPKLADVPVVVVSHVRTALGLADDVAAVHESDRTLWRHRDYVRDRLNVVYRPAEARAIAEKAIRKAVTTKDNPADLINVALEELVRARRELPGFTTLDKMVSAIRTETNTQLFGLVATRLDAADRRRLARLLWVDPTSKRSDFDRLKTPAKAASLGKFKLRLAHLQALDELGATERWLDGIPATKIAHFAGEARVTDVGDLRDIGEGKRWTLLASLIHECRTTARDEVATMAVASGPIGLDGPPGSAATRAASSCCSGDTVLAKVVSTSSTTSSARSSSAPTAVSTAAASIAIGSASSGGTVVTISDAS
ncbi:MAG: DUF4158 domain-containing protein [Pseudonocardiales bacterium]